MRAITEDDLPFLQKVYRSTREEELRRTPWTEDQKKEFIHHQFHAQHNHYIQHYDGASLQIIFIRKQPAGRLYFHDQLQEIRIMDIAFLPSYRGQGWGTAILKEIQRMGCMQRKAVGIHVEKNNPAMNLYIRLGFKKQEDKGVYDFMRWDHDVVENSQKR